MAAASKPPPPFPTSRFLYHVPGNRLPVSRPSETVVSSLNSHRLSSTLLDLADLFVRVRLLFDRQQSRDIGRVFQFDCYFRHRSWLCVCVCVLFCVFPIIGWRQPNAFDSMADCVGNAEVTPAGADDADRVTPSSSLSFIEQIRQLPSSDADEPTAAGQDAAGRRRSSQELLPDQPPEILVAYLSGQPEAVAAIELLREAQRIWDQRKRSTTPSLSSSKNQESSLTLDVQKQSEHVRRYSHEDLRIAYTNISAQLVASERMDSAGPLPVAAKSGQPQRQQYRRRPSTQAESLSGQAVARYHQKQQNAAAAGGRKRNGSRTLETEPSCSSLSITPKVQRPRSSRGSVDIVSQAMTTAGMAGSRRKLSLTESACLKVAGQESGRRPSNHRLHGAYDVDVLLPLGTDAASFHREQRRRASSKASAIFLVSPSSKETQLVPEPEDEDDGSPEGRRRRRTISIIATVGAFLLVLSILMVTVTLRLATHIDDLGTYWADVTRS